jgi:hypothetical protein
VGVDFILFHCQLSWRHSLFRADHEAELRWIRLLKKAACIKAGLLERKRNALLLMTL